MTLGPLRPHTASARTPEADPGRLGAVVGVVGLGNLGLPIARRLASVGINVIGFDVNAAALEAAEGLPLAASVREAAERADIVLVLVSDASQCRSVLCGPDGITSAANRLPTIVFMATIGPNALSRLIDELASFGPGIIDAPVSGGSAAAAKGDLSLMVGGSPGTVERWRPVLEVLGTVHVMGPVGAGQSAKLANQMVFFGSQSVLQEALALASASGVDRDALLTALSGGTADCWSVRHPDFLEEVARSYDAAKVPPSHRPWHKDLLTAIQTTAALGVDTPVTNLVSRVFGDSVDVAARRPRTLTHP